MEFPAIDVHGHCGRLAGTERSVAVVASGSGNEIVQSAESCGIKITCVSELGALSPHGETVDINAANRRAQEAADQCEQLRFWAVLNPKEAGWQDRMANHLTHPKCVGVKLHPRWNHWDVEQYGDEVFSFLQQCGCVAITHTGDAGSEPERFVPFANRYPGVKLILTHLGHDGVDDRRDRQVEAMRMCTQGNVWVDTSSARSIRSGLIEYAVRTIGAASILFGTDTPLYFAAMQKARIAYADIADDAKTKILYRNAAGLLGLG